jgi:Na+:H+ antiporter, NhaA family
LIAAAGGVIAPALIYVSMNTEPTVHAGWAIPTATDIAFAVGVLALLGRSVPSPVRILLLSLAVIDDIAAIIIIALFYSGGVDPSGLWIAGLGVLLVLGFQRLGINAAFAYALPALVLWLGFLKLGVHPTLAGVVLGLLTPAKVFSVRERPTEWVASVLEEFGNRVRSAEIDTDARVLVEPAKQLQRAQRDIVPPVIRVQAALHPWVAYGIMPLFALANAGVTLESFNFDASSQTVLLGVGLGLLLGKPIGIFFATFAAVRIGVCRLPLGLSWSGVLLVGFLGAIGFTMSIFIANLAFQSESLLGAAKLGVLIASGCAAVIGLIYGKLALRSQTASANQA